MFTAAPKWERPKGPLVDKSVHTVWSIHTPECDPAPGREDVLPPATAWTDPEVTVRGGRSQAQKDTSRVTPLLEASRPQRQRAGGGSQGWGQEAGSPCFLGTQSQSGRWKVLETGGGGGCTTA